MPVPNVIAERTTVEQMRADLALFAEMIDSDEFWQLDPVKRNVCVIGMTKSYVLLDDTIPHQTLLDLKVEFENVLYHYSQKINEHRPRIRSAQGLGSSPREYS
jgi:hypothetical protein